MPSVEEQRSAALALLAATGIRRANYLPPAVRVLWSFGVNVPPPHFASFLKVSLLSGGVFGVLWGSFMWLFVWRSSALPFAASAGISILAGAFFGILMAAYYAYGRRKYKLPSWESLGSATTSA
jgi:hypothetical protein